MDQISTVGGKHAQSHLISVLFAPNSLLTRYLRLYDSSCSRPWADPASQGPHRSATSGSTRGSPIRSYVFCIEHVKFSPAQRGSGPPPGLNLIFASAGREGRDGGSLFLQKVRWYSSTGVPERDGGEYGVLVLFPNCAGRFTRYGGDEREETKLGELQAGT